MQRWLTLTTLSLPLLACSFHGGSGGGTFAPGTTQADVTSRLTPQERVLFRDDQMMIVETPRGTRQLRFDERGRLQTDLQYGGGVR